MAQERDNESEDDEVDERYVVPGLSRGIAMLRMFSRERPEISVAELAAGAGVSRSSAYRLIYTLETEGLIARTADQRRYALTGAVLGLGFHYLSTRSVGEVAQPYLEELSRRTRLSTYLAVLDGADALYVAHEAAKASLVSSLHVGSRQKAWSTASGQVLLASLDAAALDRFIERHLGGAEAPSAEDVRRQVAENRERGMVHRRSDFDPHMASCAAPVRGQAGKVVAALTAIGPASLVLDPAMERTIESEVKDTALAISNALGARPV